MANKASTTLFLSSPALTPYKLYERYTKELSDNPYGSESTGEKCKNCLVWAFFKTDTRKDYVPHWALSDEVVGSVVRFMGADQTLGFIGLSPSVLHDVWEFYMLPHLYALWCKFIYGDDQNIVPDFKNFCLLVWVQVHGNVEERARVVFEILLEKGFKIPRRVSTAARPTVLIDDETPDQTVTKYEVVRYFYDLTASYLYGLGRSNNPEYLLWESCYAGLNETNLKMCMKYYTQQMNYKCNAADICLLLKNEPFLRTILKSSVSMMFGFSYSLNIVPFLDMPRATMLDVSQATFLASIIRGNENINFEMEMIYSQAIDGINYSTLHEKITRQGPTLVIVKDEMGYVFGGYASVSWTISNYFIGNNKCFLFRLLPNVVVCRASERDRNYMYLNVRKPSVAAYGLGMGGSMGKFGFWLDLTSEAGGCSNSCPTYNDFECLSKTPTFVYVQLEVWRVMRRDQKQDQSIMPPALRSEPSDALNLIKRDYKNVIDKSKDESAGDAFS